MLKTYVAALAAAVLLVAAPVFAAEEVPLADGHGWQASSELEKVAYMVAISNFLSIEYAYQHRNDNPPDYDQTMVQAFWDAGEDVGIDDAIKAIDKWYRQNPDKKDRAVINVAWVIWVRPMLAEKK